MHRFRIFLLAAVGSLLAIGLVASSGCGNTDAVADGADGAGPKKDSSAVDPAEAGDQLGNTGTGGESCDKYCSLVTANCTGANAQYASNEECLAFCAHLPLDAPTTATTTVRASPSLACRQYWADTPAHTNPNTSCLAAGPFGGNVCGDRCTAFCGVLLDTCAPAGPDAVYDGQPDCASACAAFTYLDAGTDGGGEGAGGPDAGDSLNCRLFHLRGVTLDPSRCLELRSGEACGP